MKKLIFSLSFLLVALFPLVAQEATESEQVPEESLTLKKGNIPPAVLKMAEDLFKEHSQVEWGMFPYELKNYGWVVNKDYNEPIDHYEIHMKTKNGIDVFAVFESTGELVRYRTIDKNAAIPESIVAAIGKSQYKDWKIAKGTEVITDKQQNVVEHYAVKLEKGNQKKTVYYNIKGEVLTNKR